MKENFSIRAYFNAFMKIVEDHYIQPKQIDAGVMWEPFAKIPEDAPNLIEWVKYATNCSLNNLNKHSFYMDQPQVAYHADGTPHVALVPTGGMKDGNIAYISIPSANFVNRENGIYVRTGRELVASMMAQNPVGAIIDVSNNTGGDCYQMVAAIAPFLDEENLVHWIGRDGKPMGMGVQWDHIVSGFIGDDKHYRFSPVYLAPANHSLPVAVIQNGMTLSSGEITALSLRGSRLSKSFGEVTGGYTTCNTKYDLPFPTILGEGIINLTTANLSDRTGTIFNGNGIDPDVACDNPIERAIEWIREFKHT